jgi:hypothetical protein
MPSAAAAASAAATTLAVDETVNKALHSFRSLLDSHHRSTAAALSAATSQLELVRSEVQSMQMSVVSGGRTVSRLEAEAKSREKEWRIEVEGEW